MKAIILMAGILLPVAAHSQSTDSTAGSRQTIPAPKLGAINVTYTMAPISANGNTFTMQQPTVDFSMPVYKNFKSRHPILLKTGLRYQGLFLSGEKNISSTGFHSLSIPLVLSYSVSRAINISFVGLAAVGSDFKSGINAEDIIYAAGIRVGFQQNRSFKYGVTLTYVRNYAGTYLLPLPDFDWTINPRLSFTGLLPTRSSLKYKISKDQSLGITMNINGSMYRLNEAGKDQYLHLRQNSAGVVYDLKLGSRWKMNLFAGHTFMQRLETFNMDQRIPFNEFNKLNERSANVSYLQNSFMLQTGLSYQF